MTRDIRKVSVHPSTVLSGKWSAISSARPAIFNDHLGGGFAAAQQTRVAHEQRLPLAPVVYEWASSGFCRPDTVAA